MARADYQSLLTAIDKLYAAAFIMFEAQNAFVCEVEYRERNPGHVSLPQPKRNQFPAQHYETLIDEGDPPPSRFVTQL